MRSVSQPHLRSIAINTSSSSSWRSRALRVCTANLCAEHSPGDAESPGPSREGVAGIDDWHGAPVGLGGEAALLPASPPEGVDLLGHLLCADENLEEQSQKEAVAIVLHCTWAPGQLEDLPQCHSCLPKTKHPETALSAQMSMWQGPSVAGRGQGRPRGIPRPGAPQPAPKPGLQPSA